MACHQLPIQVFARSPLGTRFKPWPIP